MIRLLLSGPQGFRRLSRRLATALLLVALWMGLIREPARATDVPLLKHTIDGAFDGSHAVYAADVDKDGDLDILGAASDDNSIAWWENPGGPATTDGTPWIEHTIDASFGLATSVFAADVDGDGDTDMIGVSVFDEDVAWWENPGGVGTTDGTPWTKHTVDSFFRGGRSVRAADIDRDGDTDILGAAVFDDDIAWWENPGGTATTDGTSWTKHTLDVSFSGAISVHAADVDGDGNIDILGAAIHGDDIAWWENPGGASTTDGSPWAKHTIDGSFLSAASVHAADVDGDGDTDILGAAGTDNDISWWENPGGTATTDGTDWTKHTVDGAFGGALTVFATDIDGDGDIDILGGGMHACSDDSNIRWWENPGGAATTDGTPWVEHAIEGSCSESRSVFAADIDGDGDTDILGAIFQADEIAWWENRTIHRKAVFPIEHRIGESFDGASSVFAADVDGDGDTDILGAAFWDDDITWWENPGGTVMADGSPWAEHTISNSVFHPSFIYAADMDGDGDTDILAAIFSGGDIVWWENPGELATTDGTPWVQHTLDDSFFAATAVYAADVDRDGNTDVLGASFGSDAIAWWRNPGGAASTDGTPWEKHVVNDVLTEPISTYAADIDGDGDTDILGAVWNDDDIKWWENPGGTNATNGSPWPDHTIDGSFDGAQSVSTADIDGDGDIDIIGAASIARVIAWWENPGGTAAPPWTKHTLAESFRSAQSTYARDVDGDGDTDVVGAGVDNVAWWENPGGAATRDQSLWIQHTIDGPSLSQRSIYAADVNGDGDTDILGTAFDADKVTWWENRGGQFGLPSAPLAPAAATPPGEQAVLQIDAVHNGRTGDTDVELVTFELMFDDGATPLTDSQANSVIENLRVYLDDGSGALDPADTLVDTVSTLSLTNGIQHFAFADGNTDGQVMFGTDRRYFVTLDLLAGGLLDLVRITHVTESSSTAEDRDHDIPLTLEFSSNVSATTIVEQDGVCPAEVIRANTTLGGTQSLQASTSAILGSNLVVDGDDVSVHAPVVSILADTSISGTFSIGNSPSCP